MSELVPLPFLKEQTTPSFVQEWTVPVKPIHKKFRSGGKSQRPVLAIPYSAAFEGFTIQDEAVAIIDPFPCAGSLTYVQSMYPKMPVRELEGDAFDACDAFDAVPNYADTWIVTCVPHGISTDARSLALLKRHKETDFYKCFFHTLLYSPSGCAGGWLLVPLAFFMGLNDTALRYTFLSRYRVTSVHLFDKAVLRDDPCVYISFCFERSKEMLCRQLMPWTFLKETRLFPVNKDTDWTLCADLYTLPRSVEIKRYLTTSGEEPTGLVLHATDSITCGTRISMSYDPHKQYGSVTSKNISTLVVKGCALTEEEQRRVAEEFTIFVEELRAERWSLFLSPMDDCGTSRRRIPFKLAFVIAEHIVSKIIKSAAILE